MKWPGKTSLYSLQLLILGALTAVGPAVEAEYCEGPSDAYEECARGWCVQTARQLRHALCEAESRDGDPITIYVDEEAEIDLTGSFEIPLYAGVTLASGRRALEPGALLYTNSFDFEGNRQSLFRIFGPNVTVSGLRFRGPTSSKKRLPRHLNAIFIRGQMDVRIAGNEFYDWSYGGVFAECFYEEPAEPCGGGVAPHSLRSRMNKENAQRIRITRNYFHENSVQGRGYGVALHRGAYALIDRNTFRLNRHAVASGGEPRTGYIARLNYVYPDGLE